MSRDHREIIHSLGGAPAIAAKLGVGKSTVGSWRDRGSVPSRYWLALVQLAVESGVSLTVDDLVATAPPRKPYTRNDAAKCGRAQVSAEASREAA